MDIINKRPVVYVCGGLALGAVAGLLFGDILLCMTLGFALGVIIGIFAGHREK